MYFTYVVRTDTGTLYTGVAKDPAKRLRQHANQSRAAAKYTKSHPIRELCALWSCDGRSQALRLEAALKGLTKEKKEALIREPRLFKALFPRLEGEDYLHHPKASLPLFLGEVSLKDLL